jgi:hypothetical protein
MKSFGLLVSGIVVGVLATLLFIEDRLTNPCEQECIVNPISEQRAMPERDIEVQTLLDADVGGIVAVEELSHVEAPDGETLVAPRPSNKPSNSAEQAERSSRAADRGEVRSTLPEQYTSLLGRTPGPRRMTPAENQEFFDADKRDEQWAYAMELGISQYFSANLSGEGMSIEHIECRARMCQIAGVVYPGFEDRLDEHLEAMRQSGWWQLSESQNTVGVGSAEGMYRFISYIPRNSNETIVPVSSDCRCD